MINFKNHKIIKKIDFDSESYYLLDKSEAEYSRILQANSDDPEALMLELWSVMLCDEKGELVSLSEDDIKEVPILLKRDICDNIQKIMVGEKKS